MTKKEKAKIQEVKADRATEIFVLAIKLLHDADFDLDRVQDMLDKYWAELFTLDLRNKE